MTTLDDRHRNLLPFLAALAKCKESKPGIVTRAFLEALAKIPTLTPEMVAKPSIAILVRRLGLSPKIIARGRQAKRDAPTREMLALERLWALAKHTTPTPEVVLKTLLTAPEKEEIRKALARQATQRGKKGAAARHATDNEKREAMRAKWATGHYETKILCAEQEYEALGMSLDTARKALRGAFDPNSWPAKLQHKKQDKT
jgi:hypothetical protein